MPIQRHRYPVEWPLISQSIRFGRAAGRCEGSPAYPDCQAIHGQPHPVTGSIVYLQTAHWPDPDPANNAENNLNGWCALCHNSMDAEQRLATRRRNIEAAQLAAGQQLLFEEE